MTTLLCLVIYFAALDRNITRCEGRPHFVCVLDQSSGAIEAFFGLFAVVGVAIAVVGIALAVKDIKSERVGFQTILLESAYEAVHNLHHLADGLKEGWSGWPALSTRMARRMTEPDKLVRLRDLSRDAPAGGPVWSHADHVIRNDDYIKLAMARDSAPSTKLGDALGYTMEHCVRFIIDSARADAACAEMLGHAQVGDELLKLVDPKSASYTGVYWMRISVDQAIKDLSIEGKVDPNTTLLLAWDRPPNRTDDEILALAQGARAEITGVRFIGEFFRKMPDPPHRTLS